MTNLQAIVLAAGTGSRMVELTRGRPKCLLPVGNHSLIWFAITGLKTVGVKDIICLVPDIYESEIKQYCNKKFSSHKDLKLEFACVSFKDDCGTAQSIISIKDRIKGDFIVYSCDTIIPPEAVQSLINHYRLYDSTLTMLFIENPEYFQKRPVPGRNEKEKMLRDIVALELIEDYDRVPEDGYSENRLVFIHSERDLKRTLRVKNRELALHPALVVNSCFLDSHLYIFKRIALNVMEEYSERAVLKAEIIPLLVSKQFSLAKSENRKDEDDEDLQSNINNSDYESELKHLLEAFHHRNVVASPYFQIPTSKNSFVCQALVKKEVFAQRVNSLSSYMSCNKEARNLLNLYGAKLINYVKENPVGEATIIGDKCTIKRSCIGASCKIGEKVKLFDCVIMDNVEIESATSLVECIVGAGSKIGAKCDLKLCIVGSKQNVPPGRKSKNEVVTDDGYAIDLEEP